MRSHRISRIISISYLIATVLFVTIGLLWQVVPVSAQSCITTCNCVGAIGCGGDGCIEEHADDEFVWFCNGSSIDGTGICWKTVCTGGSAGNSTCNNVSFPASMQAGSWSTVQIDYTNNGTTTWDPGSNYKLGAQYNTPDGSWWGTGGRVGLPYAVAVGSTVRMTFNIHAPSTTGWYPSYWQMLQEGISWFGSACGANVYVYQPVTVGGYITSTYDGSGIQGQYVTVYDDTNGRTTQTAGPTDASGHWTLSGLVRSGDAYAVTAPASIPSGFASGPNNTNGVGGCNSPGYYGCQNAGSGDCGTNCSFSYVPYWKIRGTITDAQTGLPMSGVPVSVYQGGNPTPQTVNTDGSGVFRVDNFIVLGQGYAVRPQTSISTYQTITGPPSGSPGTLTTDNSWWGWVCGGQNHDTAAGSNSYECQKAGQNDCAGPGNAGWNRCNFNYQEYTPTGYLDGANCSTGTVRGWTCQLDHPSTALNVDVYHDGPAGGGGSMSGFSRVLANNAGEAGIGSYCAGYTNHRFSEPIPYSLMDNKTHTIYAYGINPDAGHSNFPALGNSGLASTSLTCAATCPQAPTVSANVNCDSQNATISWAAMPNAQYYHVRVSDGDGTVDSDCPASGCGPQANNCGGSADTSLDVCINKFVGTSMNVKIQPGHQYQVWIHSGNDGTDSNNLSCFWGGTNSPSFDNGQANYANAGSYGLFTTVCQVCSGAGCGGGTSGTSTTGGTSSTSSTSSTSTTSTSTTSTSTTSTSTTSTSTGSTTSTTSTSTGSTTGGGGSGGGVVVDAGHNSCASGAIAYSGTSFPVQLVGPIVGGSPIYNQTVSTTGTFGFSNVPNNPTGTQYTISASPPSGYTVKNVTGGNSAFPKTTVVYNGANGGTFSLEDLGADVNNITFCLANTYPWFTTLSGDVREGLVIDRLPTSTSVATTYYPTSSDHSFYSVFTSLSGISDFGQYVTAPSAQQWNLNNYAQYNTPGAAALGHTSFDFYLNRAKSDAVTIKDLSGSSYCNGISPCTLSNLATGVYEWGVNGKQDLTLKGITIQSNAHVTILVNGNLTLAPTANPANFNTVPAGGLLIVAAQGNMTIASNVGTSTITDTAISMSGIYTAERNITIASANPDCSVSTNHDNRLNVEGSLLANSVNPMVSGGSGKVINNRTLCSQDAFNPVFTVTTRPDFWMQLTDFYKVSTSTFRELQ